MNIFFLEKHSISKKYLSVYIVITTGYRDKMINIYNYMYNSFENICVKVHILYNKIVIVISQHNNND